MIIRADARYLPLADSCVHCCVTSPPYWGLRRYPDERQIGLEPTPEAYVQSLVQVFREVSRVLRDDGTVWLNLGDSYASAWATSRRSEVGLGSLEDGSRAGGCRPNRTGGTGLKEKDLIGIPWRVALALQQPQYHGQIANREDRIWLAAMLDAEGCMFIHKRKAGQSNGQGYKRQNDNFGPGVEICNTSERVVERIMALVGKGSICSQGPEQNSRRKQKLYRWNLRTTESKEFVQELYPHLVAKQQQARILYGCPSSGERAEAAHAALIGLHNGIESSVDFPAPASLFTSGWYLRSDIIWAKNNPMPESVTDRPTKAHEYLFLLAKNERYWYDAKAIAEPASPETWGAVNGEYNSLGLKDYDAAGVQNPSSVKARIIAGARRGHNANSSLQLNGKGHVGEGITRNRRSVWSVPTMPYAGAHFATMPEALVEPCILAGCPLGGLVLDPFCGTGTVLAVAARTGRRGVGIDLSYQALAKERTAQRGLLFG